MAASTISDEAFEAELTRRQTLKKAQTLTNLGSFGAQLAGQVEAAQALIKDLSDDPQMVTLLTNFCTVVSAVDLGVAMKQAQLAPPLPDIVAEGDGE